MNIDVFHVLKKYLSHCKITLDTNELRLQLLSHPTFPSLQSLTGVLDHFNVSNLAIKVPVDKDIISQLPKEFIAQIYAKQGNLLALVKEVTTGYEVTFSEKETSQLSKTDFLNAFQGIVLVAEKDESTHSVSEPSKAWQHLTLASLILLLISFGLFNPEILNSTHLILSLAGVFVSYSIYKQEQGETSTIGNALCNADNVRMGCHAVISSKGAILFNKYKLSDLSMSYFLATSLMCYLNQLSNTPNTLLFLLGLIVIPITLYSIYYQAIILKQWCALCLTIVALLWTTALLILVFWAPPELIFSWRQLSIAVLVSTFSYFGWLTLRDLLTSQSEKADIEINYLKFKKNFNIFSLLLSQEEHLDVPLLKTSEIILGNATAKTDIVLLTNPFCGHCQPLHALVENLLTKHQHLIQIRIRFRTDPSKINSTEYKIITSLISIYQTHGQEKCLLAMHDAYGKMNPKDWIEKWGLATQPKRAQATLQECHEWSLKNNLNFTPVILVNGFNFPKVYEREDLIYFIEELSEQETT